MFTGIEIFLGRGERLGGAKSATATVHRLHEGRRRRRRNPATREDLSKQGLSGRPS